MSKEYDFFLESLSMLMRSSLPVREAVGTLKEEIKNKKLLKAITTIENELDGGSKMSTALQKSGLLPERFVSLLRLGEETGELQKQLSLIVAEIKKEKELHSKIRGALIYPGIILSVTFLVGIFMMWYVFPKITAVFVSAGGDLPLSTRAVIAIGKFFTSYGVLVVPAGLAIIVASIYFLFMYSKTRFLGESILMRISISRAIVEDIELARFGYIMGSMLKAGISVPQSLASVKDSTSFTLYKRFYEKLLVDVSEGNSLYKSISQYPGYERYIPSYITRLLSAGEKSGSLSETLIDVGGMFEAKTADLAANLSTVLEPVILLVVGLMVAFLAIAIIAPIYGLTDQIK